MDHLVRALKTASKEERVTDQVMVTAYEALGERPQEADRADILLLPDAVALRGVHLSRLTDAALDTLSRPGSWAAGEEAHGVTWVSVLPLQWTLLPPFPHGLLPRECAPE